MGKYKTEKITSFIFWTIATGIFLAAFLSQNWISSAKGSYGLIEWCTTKICYNYDWYYPAESPLFLNIVVPRSFFLSGAVIAVAGLLIGLTGLCCDKSCPMITEGILYIISAILIWCSCIVFTVRNYYASNIRDSLLNTVDYPFVDGQHFHYSYFFGWVSGILYIIAGVYAIAAGRRSFYSCC